MYIPVGEFYKCLFARVDGRQGRITRRPDRMPRQCEMLPLGGFLGISHPFVRGSPRGRMLWLANTAPNAGRAMSHSSSPV